MPSKPSTIQRGHSRRHFILRTSMGTVGAGLWVPRFARAAASTRANDKLNLGIIGVAGRGGDNLQGVAHENIVGLCDVDALHLEAASQKFPGAKTYRDFRRLLDREDLDAVVISTPDHTHAVAAMAALRRGLHVYCEKPLTRTVSEARRVTEMAREKKRVTQIGTQIHAGNNYRRVVEWIQRGAIGPVKQVHVWASATYGGKDLPEATPPVPSHLDYELWLGPVRYRPYSPEYIPFHWRHWWAFGGGALADFGCHFMDLPFWALGLSHARSVEVVAGPMAHPESAPPWLIVKYAYPARGDQPALELNWYHGGKQPEILTPEQAQAWKSGVLFVGEKGQLLADYGRHQLLPEERFPEDQRPEPFIPESIGHHKEWTEACKGRGETTCPFSYSGPLTEAALLGNVAFRAGQTLEWDWQSMRASNGSRATEYIEHDYRDGWEL